MGTISHNQYSLCHAASHVRMIQEFGEVHHLSRSYECDVSSFGIYTSAFDWWSLFQMSPTVLQWQGQLRQQRPVSIVMSVKCSGGGGKFTTFHQWLGYCRTRSTIVKSIPSANTWPWFHFSGTSFDKVVSWACYLFFSWPAMPVVQASSRINNVLNKPALAETILAMWD